MQDQTTSNSGADAARPATNGDGAAREKNGTSQVHNIEDSDSELESDREAPARAAFTRPSAVAHLDDMFSKKFDAMQSLVERLPRVAPPI